MKQRERHTEIQKKEMIKNKGRENGIKESEKETVRMQ
jgi:hypothetical protein